MCTWMQTRDNFNYGTLISYANRNFDNAFTLTDYTGLVIYINNKNVITDIKLNDGYWHFLCFSWSNFRGDYSVYLDGKLAKNGFGFMKGEVIEGGGTLILGQEQDVPGGKFSQGESFLGRMAYLDMWSTVLPTEKVQSLMVDCDSSFYGDLYAWQEFAGGVNGEVEIEETSFCKPCPNPKPLYNGFVSVINNTAYYKCKRGFKIMNPYENGRLCTKLVEWEGRTEPYCRSVYCGYPGYFKNGFIVGKRYHFGDKIEYFCNRGFNMTGGNKRYCSEDGTWKPEAPKCLGHYCSLVQKTNGLNITVLPDLSYDEYLERMTEFDSGTQIGFSCVEGELVGEKMSTCLQNGKVKCSQITFSLIPLLYYILSY